MSFFGKFKPGSTPSAAANVAPVKKDPNALQPTLLEKKLADLSGPVRADGSDKFFGIENYGSTCYCSSIIQCLYYSAPFREHVINFPSRPLIDTLSGESADGTPTEPRSVSTVPYPNPTSPARKEATPVSPGTAVAPRPEDAKDSPDNKKKQAIKSGPVLKMTADSSNTYFMDESLFTNLRDIFEAIISNDSRIGVVSPHRFLEILRRENEMFRSAMHQDAHEFLNLLLNQVIDDVENFSKQHPNIAALPEANGRAPEEKALAHAMSSAVAAGHVPAANGLDTHWVHDLFEGLLTSETRCLTCENTSQRDEAFLDLSVDLAAHTSVTSCLRKFSEEEMLCERNKFHCDNCGGLQEAEKRMKIKRLPRILALHLKRFKYTEDLQRLQKLFHKVVYPFHLRLFNTTDDAQDPDRLYELYAVVVHIGGGPYHGHYVAIIKTQDRGWLLFDDELVEPVNKSYVLSFFGGEPVPGLQDAKQLACAYVLFYQETTLEAMLKEQEMERQQAPAAAATRTSDAETAAGAFSPSAKNGLFQTHTVTAPSPEDMAHMEMLAHAKTAPAPSTLTSPISGIPSTPYDSLTSSTVPPQLGSPLTPVKSKKELKAEEKERKAAQKAEQKAQEKKRMDLSNRRIEAWRKQEEDLKRVMEESKVTASIEDSKRREAGDEVPLPSSGLGGAVGSPTAGAGEGGVKTSGGFAKFARTGSMSLRGKPKLFGSLKDKDKDKPKELEKEREKGGAVFANESDVAKLASVQQHEAIIEDGEEGDLEKGNGNGLGIGGFGSQNGGEERKLRHRFSLGRKKSHGVV